MFRSLLKAFIRLIGLVIPGRVISTFLGIGYLPAWQEHWASLAALLISHIAYYMIQGLFPPLSEAAFASGLGMAPFFLQIATSLLVVGVLSIFVFQSSNQEKRLDNAADTVVIQAAFGQLLSVALAMPAVVSLYNVVGGSYDKICAKIFQCPLWINYSMHLLIFFLVPFVFFNLLIVLRPWPASMLRLRYSNCLSIMSEGAVLSIYSVVLMYMLAFICAKLQVSYALKYSIVVLRAAFIRGVGL
ncbi:MAG: phosphatidylglycerophosphatase [Anaplasma sp.]